MAGILGNEGAFTDWVKETTNEATINTNAVFEPWNLLDRLPFGSYRNKRLEDENAMLEKENQEHEENEKGVVKFTLIAVAVAVLVGIILGK